MYTEAMLKKMNKDGLLGIASANGIEIPDGATNAEIIGLILAKGCPIPQGGGEPDGKGTEAHNNELVEVVVQRPYYISGDTHANYVINGTVYSVAYGEVQMVPRFVKEAIDNSAAATRILNRATEQAVSRIPS